MVVALLLQAPSRITSKTPEESLDDTVALEHAFEVMDMDFERARCAKRGKLGEAGH